MVAHAFYDMKAAMNLEILKFPWNCSITSATLASSDTIEFRNSPDGSTMSEHFIQQLTKVIIGSGLELRKGLNDKGQRMNLLIHPLKMKVSLMGQSSERDMMDMSK